MSKREEGQANLHVLCPGKVTILGFDLTGSACFDFVFSRDIIKFLFLAPEPLLGNRSRSCISPSYNVMSSSHALAQFLKYKVSPKAGHFLFSHLWRSGCVGWQAEQTFSHGRSAWPRLCHLRVAVFMVKWSALQSQTAKSLASDSHLNENDCLDCCYWTIYPFNKTLDAISRTIGNFMFCFVLFLKDGKVRQIAVIHNFNHLNVTSKWCAENKTLLAFDNSSTLGCHQRWILFIDLQCQQMKKVSSFCT